MNLLSTLGIAATPAFRTLSIALVAIIGSAQTSALHAGGDVEEGRQKAQVCASCHGEDGNTPNTPETPRLAGQYATYLEYALTEYREGGRQNAIMSGFASQLTDRDIRDLAAFYSSLEGDLYTPPQSSW